jgi:hypothetical protein
VWQRALEFPVSDPVRLLATAVIVRWVLDARAGCGDPAPEEWATLAEVPREWLVGEQRISGWAGDSGIMALP